MNDLRLLIVAGEASGDLHAARLFEELRRLSPEISGFGLGGTELEQAGLELLANSAEISVIGISEALRVLKRAREIYSRILEEVDRRGCRAAILVDFPEFNLRLARELENRGMVVIYYVSPQVWAWRQRRVKTIARVVDQMMVLFPFEVDFYRDRGIEALHVGHPLVDEVPEGPHVWDRPEHQGPFHVALLPGSRRSEIERLLPIQLGAARLLAHELPVRFSLLRASTIEPRELYEPIARSGLEIDVVSRHRFDLLAKAHLAICAAGTATLEVGLVGTPMVVVHRVAAFSYWLGRLLVRLRHASLVNLILDREVVPELLQWQATPRKVAAEAARLLGDRRAIDEMRQQLASLREVIGPPGASRRAAEAAMEILSTVE